MSEFTLKGIHHVTAITNSAERNYKFMTEILGMRLVKKTVNQDDIQTYHTFFADDIGSPGTDITFFDFPGIPSGVYGANSISRIGLRVPNDEALKYYARRLDEFGIKRSEITEFLGANVFEFEEEDGQRYRLFSDEHNKGVEAGIPWKNGPVPNDKAIYGLGPIEISVSYFEDFKQLMEVIYNMRLIIDQEDIAVFEMGEGGHGGQVIVRKDDKTPLGIQGYGEVHHVSFRVEDHKAIKAWEAKYNQLGIRHSGWVDRFFFEALYTRIGHILIELSTDGPGFMGDEPYETLGESLSLPPFLEDQRDLIESKVRPFDTRRSE